MAKGFKFSSELFNHHVKEAGVGLPRGKTEAAILSGTPVGPTEGRDLSPTPPSGPFITPSLCSLPLSLSPTCHLPLEVTRVRTPQNTSSNHQGCFLGPLPCLSAPISVFWFLCGTLGGGCRQFVCLFLRGLAELGSHSQHVTLGCVQDQGPNQDGDSPTVTAEPSRWLRDLYKPPNYGRVIPSAAGCGD